MNLYFNFFDKKNNEYVKADNTISSLKTNLENFHLKVFELESSVDLKNVTETTLVIEKENKGTFFHYKTVSATYDSYEKSFNFKDIKMTTEDISSTFRVTLEFKENGIVIFNTKEKPKLIYFKPNTEEFDIDVHDAKRIHDAFELQNENDEFIIFDISLDIESKSTTSQYRYWFDYKENSTSKKDFESMGVNVRNFKEPKLQEYFRENQTFLHVEVKDVFGNIRNKKFRVLAPGNTFSLFEIFNEPISINAFDSLIKLFIDYRNAANITPVIKYTYNKTEKVLTSSTRIGEAYYNGNVLDFKLSEHFDESIMNETNRVTLYFIVNGNKESFSSELTIVFDNKKPLIKLSNLDDENYKLIVDDIKHHQVNGMVFDDSLFYIGSENRKCGFENVTNKILLFSNRELTSISFENGETTYLYKYGKYYIAEDKGGAFNIYEDGIQLPTGQFQFIRNDSKLNKKHFYLMLDKNKLSNYEKNIIENQGGLKIKGPLAQEIFEQEFIKFSNYYVIKAYVFPEKNRAFGFTLGIDSFEYDFAKYVYDSNVSANMTMFKEINLDFTETQFIFLASSIKNKIIVFDSNKKLKNMETNVLDEISFFTVSKKPGEYFTTTESVTFIDQYLNTLPYEKIHLTPIVTDGNGNNVKLNNFTMAEIPNNDDKSYNISMDIPIEEGENFYTLKISDATNLAENVNFIIEKNTKDVEFDVQESEMLDSEIFKKDDVVYLVNNKDLCFVKVLLFNETRKQKSSDKYIIVKNGLTTEKHKIQTNNGVRFVALYLNNNYEETEYLISYDEYSSDLLKVRTKKQDGLFLKVEDNFIVGSNSYHLNFTKDDFSSVSIEYTNRQNFRCELYDKYVEIQRLKNTNFMEELQITFTVNDKNGNYSHATKTVTGKFYNETIVTDYFITGANNIMGKLDEPTFDLIVKSQDVSNILYVALYDEAELNVFNRKKVSYYDNNENHFKFSNITTPIKPSSIKLHFYIKGDEGLILERDLFLDQKIYYSKEKNKVLVSANETNDEIHINYNTSDFNEIYKKLEVFVGDKVFLSKEDVEISTVIPHIEKLKILDLPLEATIYTRLVDKKGMVSYSNMFTFDFNIKRTNISITHNFNKKIIDVKSANTLALGNFENKMIEIVAIDSYGNKKFRDLAIGEQVIDLFEAGNVYKVQLNIKDKNAKRQFYQNTIQVYDKISDLLELRNSFFEKIKLNRLVSIKNNSVLEDKDLNCYLAHYINGNYVKAYSPSYSNGNIDFFITKYIGRNKLILHYNNEKMDLSEFFYATPVINEQKIYDIKVDKNVIYAQTKDEIVLTDSAEVSLKTKGLGYLLIKSATMGRVIEKTVADNFTCRINEAWIPCTITALDSNRKPSHIKPISIRKIQSNVFTFKMVEKKDEKKIVRMSFSLQHTAPKFVTNTFKHRIEYYDFHPFLSYADSFSRSIGNTEWFKLEKLHRNTIIKNITNGIFDIEKIKEIIRKELGGK